MACDYGIIYGADGADYPDVEEDGPYPSRAAADAAIDRTLVAHRGAVIVDGYVASDGESITTGQGRIVAILPAEWRA